MVERTNGFDGKRPNILVFLVDELRVPPRYETEGHPHLVEWRRTHLRAQERLRDSGMEFLRHYTGATACAPSRTTIQTGLYPSAHGVTQVNGVAKGAGDADMFWLDADTAPTIGDYFRTAGYQTHYRGKWHVSRADILIPGTQEALASYTKDGARDLNCEALYTASDRLDPFGYSGWVGPEPHGKAPHDTGNSAKIHLERNPKALAGRDIVYAQQTVELLEALDTQGPKVTPWLIFCSFANPHDIAMYGAYTAHMSSLFDFKVDDGVPDIPHPPPDVLKTKPTAQASYRLAYEVALQPTFDTDFYRQLYYQLQSDVDGDMHKVLQALVDTRFYEDTIVVFTSDHGELLGSHGGLHQKWHVAYDEAIRVPLIVHNPRLFKGRETVDWPTSHVDLLPTLLGVAKIDPEEARLELRATHNEAQALVGRDLSPLFSGGHAAGEHDPVFFMTDDDPFVGLNENNFIGMEGVVAQPHHLLTVVATIDTQRGRKLFKYSRYYANTQFTKDEDSSAGAVPDEFEMYNLDDEPDEIINLINPANSTSTEIQSIRDKLDHILREQCEKKRLPPQSGTPDNYMSCREIWRDVS